MIVSIALALARLKQINPTIAAAVTRHRARQAGTPEPNRRRADPYPRLYRPSEN